MNLMLSVWILMLTLTPALGHIYSSTPKVTYNFNGHPQYYSLFLSLETGIGASDFLRIAWPQALHTTLKSQVSVRLIVFSNNLQVATANCNSQSAITANTYHVTLGYAMQPNTWYQVQIYPNRNPGTTPVNHLAQVSAVSAASTTAIIYDSNLAFGYVNILAPLSSTGTLTIAGSSSSADKFTPASIYSYNIDLTPSISSSTGGNFTLQIYYDAGTIAHDTGTTFTDFTFMGLCQSSAIGAAAAAQLNFCSISDDLLTITFSMNTITAGTAIRITTSISNPQYRSIRGINGYWTEFISGRVMENGLQASALTVNSIAINTVSPRIQLFWGIDSTFTDSLITTPLPLFKAQSASPNILVYNSFNIGFSFASASPITGQYTVQITLLAKGMLQGSIAHNFPAYTGKKVYCSYDTAGKKIVCRNVGAFINTSFRYFVSGKAFFDSVTASSVAFGAVAITPIAYRSDGTTLIAGTQLYTSLAGQATTVEISKELLDTSGYHNVNSRSIGNAQVVSYEDDLSLSSTANGIRGFLQGTNSSVGVVPDLGKPQQLLFLLRTTTSDIKGASSSRSYSTQLMFNNKVIGFQSAGAGRGLDFVGYDNVNAVWSIQYSPCFYNSIIVCQKYNNDSLTFNKHTLVNTAGSSDFYGWYNFQCGQVYTAPAAHGCPSGDCSTQCNMFTGFGTSDKGSSVMAMRQITLPSGYHSPIYADSNLLDFLFIFRHNTDVISYCLVNGYTVTGARMQNIKAAYVNYYDNSGTGDYNKGVRIPMMVRIGGGVLPAQSLQATAIGIFFDDYIDSSTFYTTTGSSWAVGCSTNNCEYLPNAGLSHIRTDNWLGNRVVFVYNLPPIQNEFNILVPVTPDITNRNPPKTLTIAFFTQDYTVGGVTGLLQTRSVYRLFGPVVTGSVGAAISTINGMAKTTSTPNTEMTGHFASSGSFSVSLNTTNMYSSPTNNTFTYSNTNSDASFGTTFGAGYTITSFYYNIFESSTLAWQLPPANTATTCTIFGYVYNQIQSVGANAFKNGRWMYNVFCPIDSTFNMHSANANINFLNPQYPTVFANNYPLRSLMSIAYSRQDGLLRGYRIQTHSINTLVHTCTTAKLQPYNPGSSGLNSGRQRATYTITTPAITMSASGYDGYNSFRVRLQFPTSTIGSSGFAFQSICDVSLPECGCIVTHNQATDIYFVIDYNGLTTLTVTYFEFKLYGTATNSFSTAADYIITIQLPQYLSASSIYTPFGPNYNSVTTYATCSSSFTVGITPYGTTMNLNNLVIDSTMRTSRSSVYFSFGPSSYREVFYSTSTFIFDYGFMRSPNSNYVSRSNFRCMVYEGPNSTSLSLSSSWSTLTLSNLALVTLTPKGQINNPASIVYSMRCYGGGVTDISITTAITGIWRDNSVDLQTATGIAYNAASYMTPHPNTATISVNRKRFRTSGFKSFYSLAVSCNTALTSSAVYYFDFHMSLSSNLDNQGVVQCYIRTAAAINDAAAQYTYCTFVNPWQLMVWNNLASITAGTTIYIDVYNIDQPMNGNIGSNQRIGVTIDADGNYMNGALAYAEVQDVAPPANAAANILILTRSVTNSYILSTQTLAMTIDTQVNTIFASGNSLYVLFPAAYASWITRSSTIVTSKCDFRVTGSATNSATSCTFISQRMLKIVVASVTNTLFTLTLTDLRTPAAVPNGRFNQYRFRLLVTDVNEQAITYYSFTDYSDHLSLIANPSLISLSWNSYSLSVSNSFNTLTPTNNQVITVQKGYYSRVIQLRQSIYPSNFKTSLDLTLANYPTTNFNYLGGKLAVVLGKPTAYFRIAAADTTNTGLYTLQFSKTGDTNGIYTNIPPLALVVQSTQCSLRTAATAYTLPRGGSTLPILIDAVNCIPVSSLTIAVTFTGTGNTQFTVNTDLSSLTLNSDSPDGQLYLVFRHTVGSLIAGNSVTATFTLSGASSSNFATIPSITLTLLDSATFQTVPTATALTAPILSGNTATLQLQCSQASRIYWGVSVYPKILDNAAVDFQARIVSGGNGLRTNFTQADDYHGRVYGVRQGTSMQVISNRLYHLKSNTNYLFKYFCINQMGLISDSQSINFTSMNYGAYLMKVQVTLRGAINYKQYNDLACSMAQFFIIPYARVLTQASSYCGKTPYIFYKNDTAPILNSPDSNGWYIYGFYIEPDYTLASDSTNSDIRSQLSLSTSATTIITSTANYIDLPSLVQMQTYDIQIYTTPILSISAPISGLTSIVITASITNMNGFIVVGVLQGSFNGSSQTLPSTTNLKSGIFSSSVNLTKVQMVHTNQNYNTTLQFTQLTPNTVYSLFYFCTVQDPEITSLASGVNVVMAQTLQLLTIDINWQRWVVGVMVVGIMTMIL